MRTLNLDFFAKDAISKREMNFLKGGQVPVSGNNRGDLVIPPSK